MSKYSGAYSVKNASPDHKRMMKKESSRTPGREKGPDLRQFDHIKETKDSTTSLEFLVCTLMNKFQLKSGQVLGLLSNENKYLLHVIIKGLKGNFSPVINWYQEILANIDHLLKVLEAPDEGWNSMHHLLDIFKAGFFSRSADVALWACKLMASLASEMHLKGMGGMAWEWFIGAGTGGLSGVLYCIDKNHSVPVESAVAVLCQFGKYNYTELFTHYLKLSFPQLSDFMRIIASLLQPLAELKAAHDEITGTGIVRFWIDLACKKGDVDLTGGNKPEERAAALTLLFEIWENFPNSVEEIKGQADFIVKLAQRANRDKKESLQLASLTLMFKLLDHFASERNPYAPVIYKSITFALVENHQHSSIREFILNNLSASFNNFPTIPSSIVIEPFIKQIRRSEGITFFYNVFDFDFFALLARHQKLKVKNAIQIQDIMAKVWIYDPIFAPLALIPLTIVSNRFGEDSSHSNFILKLIKLVLGIYTNNARKIHKMNEQKSPKQISNVRIEENPVILLAQNDRICRLLTIFIDLQREAINLKVVKLLVEEIYAIKSSTKSNDEELMKVLGLLGNASQLLKEHNLSLKNASPRRVTRPKYSIGEMQTGARMSEKGSIKNTIEPNDETELFAGRSAISEREARPIRDIKQRKVPYPKEYSLVPFKKLTVLEEKALLEIEQIKQRKNIQMEKRRLEENQKKLQEARQHRTLKKQLTIQKIRQNRQSQSHRGESIIQLREGEYDRSAPFKPVLPVVHLINLEEEEDQDIEALTLLIEERKRLFRFLFNRYKFIDNKKNSKDQISAQEIYKLLKDYGVTNRTLSHAELLTIIRALNLKTLLRNDLTPLSFEGFIELLIQIASYIYNKIPIKGSTENWAGLPHLSLPQQVGRMIEHFHEASVAKGEKIALFDNPYASSLADADVLQQFTDIVQSNPDFQLPDGYRQVEKKQFQEYYCLKEGLFPESIQISVELLDELIAEICGSHVIEPLSETFAYSRVVPVVVRAQLFETNSQKYMDSKIKPPRRASIEPPSRKSPSRHNWVGMQPKVLRPEENNPKFTPAMKLEIACADPSVKTDVVEVVRVLSDIIDSVEAGRDYIPGKCSIMNRALQKRVSIQQQREEQRQLAEERRKERALELKRILEESRPEREQRQIEEEERNKKKQENRERRLLLEKQRLEEIKKKIIEERVRKEDPVFPAQEEESPEQKQRQQEFKKKKRAQYDKQLKEIMITRAKAKEEEEEKKKDEKKKIEAIKKQSIHRMAKEKEIREYELQQKETLIEFIQGPEIQQVLARYKKPLQHIFTYISKQEDVSIYDSSAYKFATMNFSKFSKFCSFFKLVPEMMSADDMVFIFRHSTKQKSVQMSMEEKSFRSKDSQVLNFDEFGQLIVKIAIMLKENLHEGVRSANRQLEVTKVSADTVNLLLSYMDIQEDDTKLIIEKKLAIKVAESKSIKRLIKKDSPAEHSENT